MSDAQALLRELPRGLSDPYLLGLADLFAVAIARRMKGPERGEDDSAAGQLVVRPLEIASGSDFSTTARVVYRNVRTFVVVACTDDDVDVQLVGYDGRVLTIDAKAHRGYLFRAAFREIRLSTSGALASAVLLLAGDTDDAISAPRASGNLTEADLLWTDDGTALAPATAGRVVEADDPGAGRASFRISGIETGVRVLAAALQFIVAGVSAASVEATQFTIAATSVYRVGNLPVVGARKTGWGAPSGTATRTTFDTTTVTTEQLAERVKALIDDLTTHGLIGA